MTGTVICMYASPSHYDSLISVADRFKQMGVQGKVVLYIHIDDPLPDSVPEIFVIQRTSTRLGYMTALYSALIDFPNTNIIVLHDSILYDNLRLSILVSSIDVNNYVMAMKGYRLSNHQLENIDIIAEPFVFGSIPDLRHGCLISSNILHANMIDVDVCQNEFNGCEHLYFAYLLMSHSIPVKYEPGYWRECMKRHVMDAKNDITLWSEIYNEENIEATHRGVLKLSYLVSSEELHDRTECLMYNTINMLPDVPKHNHPLFYISFTSFGKRLNNLEIMVQQLKKQLDYIYAINIWIVPDEYTNAELLELRDICRGLIDVHIINDPPLKYKSYNKMVHQLTDSWYSRFNTMTIDDDVSYPTDFIQKNLETAKLCNYKLPCSGWGFDAYSYLQYKSKRYRHGGSISFNNIIEGFAGIWYPSGIFSSLTPDELLHPDIKRFGYADDIYISYLFRKMHIPTYYRQDIHDPVCRRALPFIVPLGAENGGEDGNNMTALKSFIEAQVPTLYVLSVDDKWKCNSARSILEAVHKIKSISNDAYVVIRLKHKNDSTLMKLQVKLTADAGVCSDIPVQLTEYIKI